MLVLIRRFLEAGVMTHGVVMERNMGTPQGGPLSPLLANFLLDEVDKELERRGHAFVRYADDCNVYVGSKRAGERVMALLRRLFDGLRLRINEEKSAVATATSRNFLSFSLWRNAGGVRRPVADKAMATMNGDGSLSRHRGSYRLESSKPLAQLPDADAHHHAQPLLRQPGPPQARRLTSTDRTAGCGPACPVVWQGRAG